MRIPCLITLIVCLGLGLGSASATSYSVELTGNDAYPGNQIT